MNDKEWMEETAKKEGMTVEDLFMKIFELGMLTYKNLHEEQVIEVEENE